MHNALEVDGVAFISPDLEGLSDFTAPGQEPVPNHLSSSREAAEDTRGQRSKPQRTVSGILGYSTAVHGQLRDGGRDSIRSLADLSARNLGLDASELDEAFLRTLTESWPRGCIFAYSATKKNHPIISVPLGAGGDKFASDSDSDPAQIVSGEQGATAEVLRKLRKFMPGTKSVYVPKVSAVSA